MHEASCQLAEHDQVHEADTGNAFSVAANSHNWRRVMIFETHAHYDDEAFETDRDELISSLRSAGIGTVVNVGASIASSKSTLELARKYPFIFAAVGIHPEEFDELYEENESEIRQIIDDDRASGNPRVVAYGEIGLDYHWAENEQQMHLQRESFRRQLDIAAEYELPVIIHSRDAAEDTFEIIKSKSEKGLTCDIHCYSGSPEMAELYVRQGHFIGVGGVVTFKNGKKLKETVRRIPIENILLETDCPYMAPVPHRGERNDSRYLEFVVREIAELKGLSEEEVIEITDENACRFFKMRRLHIMAAK